VVYQINRISPTQEALSYNCRKETGKNAEKKKQKKKSGIKVTERNVHYIIAN